MGDRTFVTLTVLSVHKPQVEKLYAIEMDSQDDFPSGTSTFNFEEVNYGELPQLDKLQAQGIAYISDWEKGDNYGTGETVCRFTAEGEVQKHSLNDNEDSPHISELLRLIHEPDALRKFILGHQAGRIYLPWDNQEEYGKLYMARQLINPG